MQLKNRIHERLFEPDRARFDCSTSHWLLQLSLSREKDHGVALSIQHPFIPVVKKFSRTGNKVECMKRGRSKWCKCFRIPGVILQNGHSIIEKSGRWLELSGRLAGSSGKGEPRCIGWQRVEGWIGNDTYSSCHEGLCLGLHVFDDCNTIHQSNQLKYVHQHALFGSITTILTRISRVPGDQKSGIPRGDPL